MDFKFSASEQRLRDELRAFLKETLGENYDSGGLELPGDDWQFARDFNRRLA